MIQKRVKIATPISDLVINDFNSEIIDLSDCLETRDHTVFSEYKKQELFHCELQPIHQLTKKNIEYLKDIKIKKKDLKLISFHLASCYKYPKTINNVFFPRGRKISKIELLKNAEKNFILIKKIFGDVKIAVENNNYYKTQAYDFITDSDFISSIVNQNKINLLLDIAHAKITAFNSGVNYNDYISGLPLNKIIQIHIAKPGFDKFGEAFDAHNLPSKNELDEVLSFIIKYPEVKYVTTEYYRDKTKLIGFLKKLKFKINQING